MMRENNSPSNKLATLSLNESAVEKSIIAQLPYPTQSIDFADKINSLNEQIHRLNNELNFYKKSATLNDKTSVTNSKQSLKQINKSNLQQLSPFSIQNEKLKSQINQQNKIISKLSQQLRNQKKYVRFDEKSLANDCQRLQIQNDDLRQKNLLYLKDIKELQFQLADQQLLHQRNTEIIEMQKRQLSVKGNGTNEDLRMKNMELEYRMAEMAEQINQNLKEIDTLTTQIQKMRKENVIDRQSRIRRNFNQLGVNEGSRSRFRENSMSRVSEIQLLDHQRLNLKIAQKNKEYELLYNKYQALENDYRELEQTQRDMERQRKLLQQKISSYEIHTEGDEVVGELQNKVVLMSTELMRLGHLSRTKVQESNQLNIKLKELVLKNQHLEKDLIQRDKLILNYKEELRLLEMRFNDNEEDKEKQRQERQSRQKNTKLVKEIQRITMLYKQKLQALKQSQIKNAILQQKNLRLVKQNEQLQKELKNYSINADKNKEKATRMLNQQAEINFYKQTNMNLKQEIKRIETRIYETRSDYENISTQRDQYRSMNLNLQQNYANLQEQLRRINLKLDQKQMQNRENMHRAQQKLIVKNNEIKRLDERIRVFEKENQILVKYRSQLPKYEELIKEIQRLQNAQISLKMQISNYEEKIALLAQENQRLSVMVNNRAKETSIFQKVKHESQVKDKKIRQLQKETQSLTFRQKRYRQQMENLRQRLRQNVLNERENETWQFKNRQLVDELDAIKMQLSVKEQQIKLISERYNRQYLQKQNLIRKNEQISNRINQSSSAIINTNNKQYYENQLRKYVEKSKRDGQKIRELMQEAQQQQEIYNTFSSQIMRLNQVISQYTQRISVYKKEIDFLQHKVKTCEQTLQQRRGVQQFGSEKSIGEIESKTKIQICEGRIREYEGELQMFKQRYNSMKQTNSVQQSKLSGLFYEKTQLQYRISQLEYQLSMKSESFRTVQDSFKLTILQIQSSNERLEQSMRQIQNHYISKLQLKESQCENIKRQKRQCQATIHQLQKQLSNLEIEYGSQINQKNRFISNLNTNHNQTKEEIQQIRRIKSEYEVKIALLSQQIERLESIKERQAQQIQAMNRQLKQSEAKFFQSMKDSSYHNHTLDTLSQEIERLNSVLLKNVQIIKQSQRKAYQFQIQNNTLKQQNNQHKLRKEENQRKYLQQRQTLMFRYQKSEQNSRELRYEVQEKEREIQMLGQRVRAVEEREKIEVNGQMQSLLEEMKLLREGNQNLEKKLSLITRQYQQIVQQLQYYKKSKANADQDEKMRIIGSYETTIKNMKEQNTKMFSQKMKIQNQFQKTYQRANQIQQRYNISEQKARTYQDKSRRLDERLRTIQQRLRQTDDAAKAISHEKAIVEQKLITAMEELGRLQILLKSKQLQLHQISEIKQRNNAYYAQQKLSQKKGIFIIKQVNQLDERSRSASGNNAQPQQRISVNQNVLDLQHRYQLLQSVNKKLSTENECLRKKGVEYEFKMNKLKEQFDLINRLIHQYREQNDKLKQNNKLLNLQLHQRSNLISARSQLSPQHSSINTSSFIETAHKNNFSSTSFQNSHKSNIQANKFEMDNSFAAIKAKLMEEIDRLNRFNSSLQAQVHDLRLNATENLSLRKRLQQNMAVQALRVRVREGELRVSSPPRGPL